MEFRKGLITWTPDYNFQKFTVNFINCINFRKLVVGDPKDDSTFTGALISKEHLAKVKGYVDLAEKEGATILCGKEELSLPERNKNVCILDQTCYIHQE